MFQNKRFLTRGVQAEIPIELQLFLWNCIDNLPEERDYFQVFALKEIDGKTAHPPLFRTAGVQQGISNFYRETHYRKGLCH